MWSIYSGDEMARLFQTKCVYNISRFEQTKQTKNTPNMSLPKIKSNLLILREIET